MDRASLAKKVKYWLLPEGIYIFLAAAIGSLARYIIFPDIINERRFLSRNKKFKDLHKDKRCFILGCGPSIKQQNLKLLKNEICISVSNFFVHPDFSLIKPIYHCIGALHPPFTEQDYAKWFKAMEPLMKETDLFLGYGDRRIVSKNRLFDPRKVYYLDFNNSRSRLFNKDFDLTLPLPRLISVSIMALTVAIYLGFKEIFLIGVEHTSFRLDGRFEYKHFYEGKSSIREMPESKDLEIEFWALKNLWRQYKAIRARAIAKGAKIYNATEGGLLDLFPRVKYETLFK